MAGKSEEIKETSKETNGKDDRQESPDPAKPKEIRNRPPNWRDHNTYNLAYYNNRRIITRSQSSMIRTEATKENMEIFLNPRKQQPPGLPHVMEVVKGKYGSVPKTLFTRNGSKDFKVSEEMNKKLEPYRKYHPPGEGGIRGSGQPCLFACFGPRGKKDDDDYYKKADKDEGGTKKE